MELLFLILIIGIVIIYFIAKSNKKNIEDVSYSITLDGKPLRESSESDDFEDPWYNLNEDEEQEFDSYSYPLFNIFQKYPESYKYIDEKYHSLAQELSKQKNEDIQSAIYSLLDQEKFRSNKGLPKYLQVVPIKSLISKNIFVVAQENDLPMILESMTMDSLKEICSLKECKPARSKKETIQKLLEIKLSDIIDFQSYFRLNPEINEIYTGYQKFCHILLDQSMKNIKIRLKRINKKLDPEELNEKSNRNEYILQEYGCRSMILCKQIKPLYMILDTDRFESQVILLNDGLLAMAQRLRLDRSSLTKISILNNNMEILKAYFIKDVSYFEIPEIEDRSFIYQELFDDRYWILNYETLEEKYLENPENLDIYTLIENSWDTR